MSALWHRVESPAHRLWRIVDQERKTLRRYGPSYPLRAFLDRLQYLTDRDGRRLFLIEMDAEEFMEWRVGLYPTYHMAFQPTDADVDWARGFRFKGSDKPLALEARVSDVLVSVVYPEDVIRDTTKEPA
jgi:hypothetical protein